MLNVPQPLFFNLSHTDDLLVLTISAQGEVGIDIETKRNHNFWDISKRFFHADELARMEALDQQERERSFYRLWTLKEAFFKALGIGITAGLDKIQIDLDSEPVHFTVAKGLNVPQVNWRLVEMPLNESTFLAVAHTQPIAEPRWFDGRLLLVADN
jgi:4'-phosphopantetheinyl transferase